MTVAAVERKREIAPFVFKKSGCSYDALYRSGRHVFSRARVTFVEKHTHTHKKRSHLKMLKTNLFSPLVALFVDYPSP